MVHVKVHCFKCGADTAHAIQIVSGEGEQGTVEQYNGEQTAGAIMSRLKAERCGGDRWAHVIIDDITIKLPTQDRGSHRQIEMHRQIKQVLGA